MAQILTHKAKDKKVELLDILASGVKRVFRVPHSLLVHEKKGAKQEGHPCAASVTVRRPLLQRPPLAALTVYAILRP